MALNGVTPPRVPTTTHARIISKYAGFGVWWWAKIHKPLWHPTTFLVHRPANVGGMQGALRGAETAVHQTAVWCGSQINTAWHAACDAALHGKLAQPGGTGSADE